MDTAARFRELLGEVDPAELTLTDRLALLDLVARCLKPTNDGGGGRVRAS